MATHISRGHQGEKEKQNNTHINSKHEDRGATCDDDKSKFKLLKDIKRKRRVLANRVAIIRERKEILEQEGWRRRDNGNAHIQSENGIQEEMMKHRGRERNRNCNRKSWRLGK